MNLKVVIRPWLAFSRLWNKRGSGVISSGMEKSRAVPYIIRLTFSYNVMKRWIVELKEHYVLITFQRTLHYSLRVNGNQRTVYKKEWSSQMCKLLFAKQISLDILILLGIHLVFMQFPSGYMQKRHCFHFSFKPSQVLISHKLTGSPHRSPQRSSLSSTMVSFCSVLLTLVIFSSRAFLFPFHSLRHSNEAAFLSHGCDVLTLTQFCCFFSV